MTIYLLFQTKHNITFANQSDHDLGDRLNIIDGITDWWRIYCLTRHLSDKTSTLGKKKATTKTSKRSKRYETDISDDLIDKMFKIIDADKIGFIDFQEFQIALGS